MWELGQHSCDVFICNLAKAVSQRNGMQWDIDKREITKQCKKKCKEASKLSGDDLDFFQTEKFGKDG